MDQKFDYTLEKSTFITFTRWNKWRAMY